MNRSASLWVVAGLLVAPMAAQARDHGPLVDKFQLDVGTFFYASDTKVRADAVGDEDIGTEIDLERAFNFDDESVLRVEGTWRFKPRHKVRLMYFNSDRVANNSIEEEISFDGVIFPVDIDVRAEFSTQIIQASYEYVFVRRDAYEIGASIGVHQVKFGAALSAVIDAGEEGEIEGAVRGDVNTNAPLPVFGLRGTWNVWDNLYLQAQAQYFALEFDAYDGSLIDAQASLLWAFSRHVGAGIGYNFFETDVKVDDDDYRGELRWQYDGLQLFLHAAF